MSVGRALAALLLMLVAACTGAAPSTTDRGIGGTGAAVTDRGLGGTGIIGTVTAFGSIWVNGLEIAVPDGLPVSVEGRVAPGRSPDIGNTVALTADAAPETGLEARSIDIQYLLAGPVEHLAGNTLTLLGEAVDTTGAHGFAARPGAWIAVSGWRRADGAVQATRLDPWDAADGWLVRGRLDEVGAATLRIGRFTASHGGLPAGIGVGTVVRITGVGSGAAARVTSIDAAPVNPFGSAIGALSFEATVAADGGLAVEGAGVAALDGSGIDTAGLPAGMRVVVDAAVGPGGTLTNGRAMPAPSLGQRAVDGTDPRSRAAALAAAHPSTAHARPAARPVSGVRDRGVSPDAGAAGGAAGRGGAGGGGGRGGR